METDDPEVDTCGAMTADRSGLKSVQHGRLDRRADPVRLLPVLPDLVHQHGIPPRRTMTVLRSEPTITRTVTSTISPARGPSWEA